MKPDNEMHYFGQMGLTPVQISKAKAFMRAGIPLAGIEMYLNIPISVLTMIKYGKFFK
jgi:hypothetical protein